MNVCVAGAIILRLWYTRHEVSRALSGTESRLGLSKDSSLAYLGPTIFIMVESGAIIVAVSITMLALYKTGNPAVLMCLDIATQIAVSVHWLAFEDQVRSLHSTCAYRLSCRISLSFALCSARNMSPNHLPR